MKEKKQYIKPEILVEEWKVYKEVIGKSRWGHRIYEVSNFGRVKINGVLIDLPNNHERITIGGFRVHRAVAELFIPNPENKPEVDHIDTNPSNNMVWNLRWATSKENSNNTLTRKHNSEAQKGKTLSKETKQKMSVAKSREKNPMYGKPCPNKDKHIVYNNPNDHTAGYHYE